jgi:hypothetical protein
VAAAALLSAVAAVLAAALIVKAASWPVSFTQFVAIVSASVLIALAAVFAFWAYACYTLHYAVDRKGLTIAWGTIRHYIPMERIEGLSAGRGEDRPELRGLSWPGLRVGRALVGDKEVLFYSTHRSPEEIVYVRASSATYAVSPQDPARFMAEVERFRQSAKPAGSETSSGTSSAATRYGRTASPSSWCWPQFSPTSRSGATCSPSTGTSAPRSPSSSRP